jgi:hypothetical protein
MNSDPRPELWNTSTQARRWDSGGAVPPRSARRALGKGQPIIQVTLQLLQCAWLTSSLRESPVARIENPTVRTAAVALPPLMPFFCLIRFTSTPPVTPQ